MRRFIHYKTGVVIGGDAALAHPPPGSVKLKQAERDQLANDVQAFLARGGMIKQLTTQEIDIPTLKANERDVIFKLGKSGKITERNLNRSRRGALIQLTKMGLIYRSNGICELTDRGRAVYNHKNFALHGAQL